MVRPARLTLGRYAGPCVSNCVDLTSLWGAEILQRSPQAEWFSLTFFESLVVPAVIEGSSFEAVWSAC